VTQKSIDAASPDKMKGLMDEALANCLLQLKAVTEGGADVQPQASSDFMKMVHVERMVVKIQAGFRQRLAIKRLEKDIDI